MSARRGRRRSDGSGLPFSRKASLWINDALDRYVPPVMRDSKLFGNLARRMYRSLTIDIIDLKYRAFYVSRADFPAFYQRLHSRFHQPVSHLTPEPVHSDLE